VVEVHGPGQDLLDAAPCNGHYIVFRWFSAHAIGRARIQRKRGADALGVGSDLRMIIEATETLNRVGTIGNEQRIGFELRTDVLEYRPTKPVELTASLAAAIASIKENRKMLPRELERSAEQVVTSAATFIDVPFPVPV